MINLNQWAARNGISPAAMQELYLMLGTHEQPPHAAPAGVSETAIQQQIRLDASRYGVRLWRNNNGAAYDSELDRMVRYGLANDSKKMNKVIKSSDLIGITPVLIQPEHVGHRLGVFTSVEVKRGGWKYRGTLREQAQLAWINLIVSLGGFAKFAAGKEEWKWW